jgi:hypothetical protein
MSSKPKEPEKAGLKCFMVLFLYYRRTSGTYSKELHKIGLLCYRQKSVCRELNA